MAWSLKLLICLLFVAFGKTTNPMAADPTTKAVTTEATTKAVTTEATTKAVTTDATTKAVTTDATTKAVTTDPPKPTEPPKPGACASKNPCRGESTCEDRANQTFVCLCPAGDNYNYDEQQCVRAKVFPGELTYTGANYTSEMANPTSAEFKEVADDIVDELLKVFEDPKKMYLNSIVTKLSDPSSATKTKAGAGVVASVEIMFEQNSPVTSKNVKDDISTANVGLNFAEKDLCENTNLCDETTTKCEHTNGVLTCKCNEGYLKSNLTDRVCVACPNGQKVIKGTCQPCSFGYSGFNCNDNWQLLLTVVGSLLGGFLLITIILLAVGAITSKKKLKKAKASTSYEKPNFKPAPAKTPQVSNGLAAPRPTPVKATPAGGLSGFGANGVPRIPRATTNDSWDRNTNLEMVPSNSRQNLIPSGRNSRRFDDDDDDDTSPYYSRPMKPQNNPYAVGQPQVNPYASRQGNSNPYYRQ